MTVNFGPQTVCLPHRDVKNFGASVCFDYADGSFNASRGGHIILHEARLIIELPSGCMMLFPSACITHENIPIAADETRNSLTAYFAGGLVQQLEQGRGTQDAWAKRDPEGFRLYMRSGKERWVTAMAMFKTIPELMEYWAQVRQVVCLSLMLRQFVYAAPHRRKYKTTMSSRTMRPDASSILFVIYIFQYLAGPGGARDPISV